MPEKKIVIHTDGGSRGNPGPAAIGLVIEYNGKVKEYAEYIGIETNNVAEYYALVCALKKAKQLVGKKNAKTLNVLCYSDSELMVKQLNRSYKLKDEAIKKHFISIWNLTIDFKSVTFTHIKREHNKKADKLLNQALDKEGSKLEL